MPVKKSTTTRLLRTKPYQSLCVILSAADYDGFNESTIKNAKKVLQKEERLQRPKRKPRKKPVVVNFNDENEPARLLEEFQKAEEFELLFEHHKRDNYLMNGRKIAERSFDKTGRYSVPFGDINQQVVDDSTMRSSVHEMLPNDSLQNSITSLHKSQHDRMQMDQTGSRRIVSFNETNLNTAVEPSQTELSQHVENEPMRNYLLNEASIQNELAQENLSLDSIQNSTIKHTTINSIEKSSTDNSLLNSMSELMPQDGSVEENLDADSTQDSTAKHFKSLRSMNTKTIQNEESFAVDSTQNSTKRFESTRSVNLANEKAVQIDESLAVDTTQNSTNEHSRFAHSMSDKTIQSRSLAVDLTQESTKRFRTANSINSLNEKTIQNEESLVIDPTQNSTKRFKSTRSTNSMNEKTSQNEESLTVDPTQESTKRFKSTRSTNSMNEKTIQNEESLAVDLTQESTKRFKSTRSTLMAQSTKNPSRLCLTQNKSDEHIQESFNAEPMQSTSKVTLSTLHSKTHNDFNQPIGLSTRRVTRSTMHSRTQPNLTTQNDFNQPIQESINIGLSTRKITQSVAHSPNQLNSITQNEFNQPIQESTEQLQLSLSTYGQTKLKSTNPTMHSTTQHEFNQPIQQSQSLIPTKSRIDPSNVLSNSLFGDSLVNKTTTLHENPSIVNSTTMNRFSQTGISRRKHQDSLDEEYMLSDDSMIDDEDESFERSTFESTMEKSFLPLNSDDPLQQLLSICRQTCVLQFDQLLDPNDNPTKIGEGSYGEVFRARIDTVDVALKIVPFTLEDEIRKINGDFMKCAQGIIPEAVISQQLSLLSTGKQNMTNGYANVVKMCIVQGHYPQKLLDCWDEYKDKNEDAINESPLEYSCDSQLYIVIALEIAGTDLEKFKAKSEKEALSILIQTIMGLQVAEKELEFEHRDLHIGNVLVKRVENDKTINYRLSNVEQCVNSNGLQVTIIDFTNSRIKREGTTIFLDLSSDPELFDGPTNEYQFDIYREMKRINNNDWSTFTPKTNCLWIHYLSRKIFDIRGIRVKRRKELQKVFDAVLFCDNLKQFVQLNNVNELLQPYFLTDPTFVED